MGLKLRRLRLLAVALSLLDHPTDDHTPWLMEAGTPKAHIMFGRHAHH